MSRHSIDRIPYEAYAWAFLVGAACGYLVGASSACGYLFGGA